MICRERAASFSYALCCTLDITCAITACTSPTEANQCMQIAMLACVAYPDAQPSLSYSSSKHAHLLVTRCSSSKHGHLMFVTMAWQHFVCLLLSCSMSTRLKSSSPAHMLKTNNSDGQCHIFLQVALSLNNLAALLRKMEKGEQAEKLYMRSLSIREEALGPDHPQVCSPKPSCLLVCSSLQGHCPAYSNIQSLYASMR